MNSLVICLANTDELREKIYQLRYEVYIHELGSFTPGDLPDGLEKDIYDDFSIHIAALDGKRVVGTLRLVKDSSHGFVMESAFTLPETIDREKAVEHSRGIVLSEYRKQGVYPKMLELAYDWQRENGYSICLGAPNLDRLYSILIDAGWKAIGEAKKYHNITVIPMMYELI
jgi:N-acyl amino acid synthase of PEP-CTERM/exosortase system